MSGLPEFILIGCVIALAVIVFIINRRIPPGGPS